MWLEARAVTTAQLDPPLQDVPIVVQHTRLDSRKAEISLLSTMAYAEG
jgi:hypothetical protein